MSKWIVDTNVPVTANLSARPERSDVPPSCISKSIDQIENIIKKGCLVIDAAGEILQEYETYFSWSGQPGAGDAFFKWAHDNQGIPSKVALVPITKNGDSYKEFPDHLGLKDFDPSDRKFVAVANAHPEKPPILQAKDSKWHWWNEALAEVGITVNFLCPEDTEPKAANKDKSKAKMGT